MGTAKRTYESLTTGNFTTCPDDKIVIESLSGVICNSITFELTNKERGESISFTFDNVLASWKWLKSFNSIHMRDVFVQIDDGPEIPFTDSEPYKARFAA